MDQALLISFLGEDDKTMVETENLKVINACEETIFSILTIISTEPKMKIEKIYPELYVDFMILRSLIFLAFKLLNKKDIKKMNKEIKEKIKLKERFIKLEKFNYQRFEKLTYVYDEAYVTVLKNHLKEKLKEFGKSEAAKTIDYIANLKNEDLSNRLKFLRFRLLKVISDLITVKPKTRAAALVEVSIPSFIEVTKPIPVLEPQAKATINSKGIKADELIIKQFIVKQDGFYHNIAAITFDSIPILIDYAARNKVDLNLSAISGKINNKIKYFKQQASEIKNFTKESLGAIIKNIIKTLVAKHLIEDVKKVKRMGKLEDFGKFEAFLEKFRIDDTNLFTNPEHPGKKFYSKEKRNMITGFITPNGNMEVRKCLILNEKQFSFEEKEGFVKIKGGFFSKKLNKNFPMLYIDESIIEPDPSGISRLVIPIQGVLVELHIDKRNNVRTIFELTKEDEVKTKKKDVIDYIKKVFLNSKYKIINDFYNKFKGYDGFWVIYAEKPVITKLIN